MNSQTPTAKTRSDSWAAPLSEAQRWEVFYRMQRGRWTEVAKWIEQELEITPPSKTALYDFCTRMRPHEQARRIEAGILAAQEAGELARSATQNADDLIGAFQTLAADTAMRTGDSAAAGEWMKLAIALSESRAKALELELKNRAQQTKDRTLKLAREKFEAAEKRATAAEKRADAAEAKAAALQARITALETALQDAGKVNVADPSQVAAEVDKLLGRKKP